MRLPRAHVEPGAARRGTIRFCPGLPTLRTTWVSIIYGTSGSKFAVIFGFRLPPADKPGAALRTSLVPIIYGPSGAKFAVPTFWTSDFRFSIEVHGELMRGRTAPRWREHRPSIYIGSREIVFRHRGERFLKLFRCQQTRRRSTKSFEDKIIDG
jgi:hypothetical protein